MGTLEFTQELTVHVAAGKVFKALIFDSDNFFPKLIPEIYHSVEIIEGDGGPGSIKKATFTEGAEFKYLKKRIDALDEEKMTYGYTIIEGDVLMDNVDSISIELEFEAIPDEGCKCTHFSMHNLKPGTEINKKQLKDGQAKLEAIRRAVEAISWKILMAMLKVAQPLSALLHCCCFGFYYD